MAKRPQYGSGQFSYRRQKMAEQAKRKRLLIAIGICIAVAVVGGLLFFLLRKGTAKKPAESPAPSAAANGEQQISASALPTKSPSALPSDAPSAAPSAVPTETTAPTNTAPPVEEELLAAASGVGRETSEDRIAAQAAETQELCTGKAADILDPDTWNASGKALMDALEADESLLQQGFSADAKTIGENSAQATAAISKWQDASGLELPQSYPYLIAVNRAADTVTIFTTDAGGRYTIPYMAMVCSTGPDTPLGYFRTPITYNWRQLYGPRYAQYATRIVDSILFQSVSYYTPHQDDLEYHDFNGLGESVAQGSIRLAVRDARWIYMHCPLGTPVVIYEDSQPGPMGKPGTIQTDPEDETLRGWDPTDPNPENPWPQKFRRGTAILSEAAKADQEAEEKAGTWGENLNETDLQGFSTAG